MKFFTAASPLIAACALTEITVSAQTTGAPWGYKTNDPTMGGPAQWADHYPTCGGSRQSPIDITTTTGGSLATRSLAFSGECANFNLTQATDTFVASVVGGSCAASANGASYSMAQFHIHAPSEHTLDGKPLDGEVHFVHSNADGSALMGVGVFRQVANAGTTDSGSYANVVSSNAVRTYNYPGSLTTPGCDEIVDWWVVQQPMSISSADFTRLPTQRKELSVTDNGNNARPVLPLNGRTVVSLQ
ncbi:carbonic anhydrase, putative [Phytophthora infestans T30-4]|uniref:carbonic anhydrase n=1 Tax=Phytophthora infestans (strain T30-4) TaxID=403677 RepID=D0NW67_PHYIT|nr:carbonic anhydrase, putative [Phytophthora infestans T30-4]EEY66952.1 carbonic anhydrase, putative [Phytophthora infestans T30-4]|eukprot:XP_002896670.1 carbonic anhydrase, putative [Phytophthora infestans T30-4]